MDVVLPSGAVATLRETYTRGDRRAGKRAIKFTVAADGSREMDASLEDDVTGAVLREVILSWTVPQPVPSQAANLEMAQAVFDRLPDDDYEALAAAVRPFVTKILRPDDAAPKSGPADGGTSSSAAQPAQETLTM